MARIGDRRPGADQQRWTEVLLEHAFEVVVVLGQDALVTFASPGIEQMLGYTPEEMLGQPVPSYWPEGDADELEPVLEHLLTTPGCMVVMTSRAMHKDGSIRHLESYAHNLLEDPDVRGVVINARDVTDRVKAEEHRRALEQQLLETQKLESLGALAGGVAHSFNNLLAVILGNAGLALAQLPPDAPVRGELEDIETAARQAAELTRQMLVYSGRSSFVAGSVDLSSLIAEIRELLEVAVSRTATVHYELDDELPAVAASADQLHQIVMNLAINASEALDESGGSITIRTREVAHDDELVDGAVAKPEASPPDRYVCLDVIDDGMGMDDATKSRIFDPFFSTKFTGRGLGLASVLGIVRGLHGAVRVTSAPDRGTTISVLLPAVEARPNRPATNASASPTARSEAAVVLAVDDDAAIRLLVERVLQAEGMTVLTASSGEEAIDLYRREPTIDLVLLDLTMHGMRGDETLSALRELDPDVRAVIMSGYSARDVEAELAGACVAAFLQKPFDILELSAVVRDALARRGT